MPNKDNFKIKISLFTFQTLKNLLKSNKLKTTKEIHIRK